MVATSVVIALASRHSLVTALLVYLVTSTLPLRQWVDSIGKRSSEIQANLARSFKPDISIRVRFKTPAEGGRQMPVANRIGYYACVFYVGEMAFDCRIPLGETLALGEWHRLDVTFIHPDLALPHVKVGTRIGLWEGRVIADGVVDRISACSFAEE